MAWVAAAVVGGSLITGTMGYLGASESADATQYAADQQAQIAADQLRYQKELQAPYQVVGAKGLAQLYGEPVKYIDPYTGEETTVEGTGKAYDLFTDPVTGQKISYEDMVTKQLGSEAYQQSPEYQAQNALAQKALAQQRQARGLEYSAPASAAAQSAELSQKLTASDYANYKADLTNRYNALRGQAATEYDRLTQQANLGLGATTALGSASQAAASQQAAAAQQAGQAQAGLWSGLGGAAASSIGTGLQIANTGSNLGWWGSNNTSGSITPYSSYTGWNPATDTALGSSSYMGSGQLWD